MPEIAAAAELAPGTLYLYFPSQDALCVELLIEGYTMPLADLQAAADSPGPPDRTAASLIDAFLRFAQTESQYFDISFFALQQELSGPHTVASGSAGSGASSRPSSRARSTRTA